MLGFVCRKQQNFSTFQNNFRHSYSFFWILHRKFIQMCTNKPCIGPVICWNSPLNMLNLKKTLSNFQLFLFKYYTAFGCKPSTGGGWCLITMHNKFHGKVFHNWLNLSFFSFSTFVFCSFYAAWLLISTLLLSLWSRLCHNKKSLELFSNKSVIAQLWWKSHLYVMWNICRSREKVRSCFFPCPNMLYRGSIEKTRSHFLPSPICYTEVGKTRSHFVPTPTYMFCEIYVHMTFWGWW